MRKRFRLLLAVAAVLIPTLLSAPPANAQTYVQVDLETFETLRHRSDAYQQFAVIALPSVSAATLRTTPTVAGDPQYVPIIANGAWYEDLWLFNPTSSSIVQKVGHTRFQHPGLDDIIVEPTVTLAQNEWKWLRRADLNFDADFRQVPGCYDSPPSKCGLEFTSSDPGMYVWAIDARLRAKVNAEYPSVTAFDLPALAKGMASGSDVLTFKMIGVDFQYVKNGVNYPSRGAFPTFLNLGGPATVFLSVCQTASANSCVEQTFTVGAGIRQSSLQGLCPAGCTVNASLCHGACGAGTRIPPMFLFLANGAPSGQQQAIIPPD